MRKHKAKTKEPVPAASGGATGTYVYDEKLGKVVKVSSRVPRVAAHGSDGDFSDLGDSGGSEDSGGGSGAVDED